MESKFHILYPLKSNFRRFDIVDKEISNNYRATNRQQSQNFSAFLKVYETSTNQISRWYHEVLQSN